MSSNSLGITSLNNKSRKLNSLEAKQIDVDKLNSGGASSFPDGTAAAPSISFASDPDTGLYRVGANNIGISAGGAQVFDITDDAVLNLPNALAQIEIDGTKVLDSQQAAIGALTDSSGGADAGAGGTIAVITQAANAGSADIVPVQNAIATLAGQQERILSALRAHGLIAT